jgi:hypothetical protein
MDRFVWAIESSKGFLCSIEEYTADLHKAAVFIELDTALERFTTFRKNLKEECRVTRHKLPFPRLERIADG